MATYLDNTIFRPEQAPNGTMEYLLRLISDKADKKHTHVIADIIDFREHNHDDRYYKIEDHLLKMWYSGNGEPDIKLGWEGDFYLDTLNADIYKKGKENWVKQMNLIGPEGPKGPDGESAYSAALNGGFTGTRTDFYYSLASIGNLNQALDVLNGEVV